MGLLLIIPLLILLIIIAFNLYNRFRHKLPPGPTPRPIFGNLFDIKPVRFRCFYEWAQQYGPIISFKLGSQVNVVVSNAELAKKVLKEHDQNLADRYRGRSFGIFSKGGMDLIWADYGPHFVKVKKFSTLHLFSQKRVEALRHIREDEVNAMIAQIFHDCTSSENEGKPLKIKEYLGTLSLNHIARLSFAKRVVNSKGEYFDDPLAQELKVILTRRPKKFEKNYSKFLGEYVPWLWWLYPANDDKAETDLYNARINHFVKGVIENYAKLKSQNIDYSEQHFVDALLTYKDEFDLGEDTLITLLWDMVIAGIDTVAISVEWALAELIRNPRVQRKAQMELDQVIGNERIVTEADFSNLPYLQALAKESLRLHPPTPLMLPHKAKEHVKISGYDIPKESILYVNVWALGRDPNVWTDPSEFRPERFFEEDVDMKGSDFRLLPFGAGRRICPGAQMGINLIVSVLGHFLHQFDWNPPNGIKPEEFDMGETPGHVTYMRTPLQAIVTPRLSVDLYEHSSTVTH